ncbi:response regulator transcription factor [Bacillus sp. BRMEA1]|uniref:response regulator transcription factor n=1 Tax=Neobacillus endophyticus TaxID=2738405 RepID=UPI0015663850|nr:response regulator transcription factor [Neobacillus endophyticus]NRD81077.1 response regulator transcription factor [Neobacillus endophyticus]
MKMLILDNQSPYRLGAQKLIELRFPNVVTDCHNVDALFDMEYIATAEILLIDPSGLSSDSAEKVRTLLTQVIQKGVDVIVYTTSVPTDFLMDMLSIGVKGYLLKSSSYDFFMQGIWSVMNGERYVDISLVSSLIGRIMNTPINAESSIGTPGKVSPEDILTKTEWAILELFIKGSSNAEIAKTLFLSESTISQYMRKITSKFEVPSRTAAAIKAVANGWIDVSEYLY